MAKKAVVESDPQLTGPGITRGGAGVSREARYRSQGQSWAAAARKDAGPLGSPERSEVIPDWLKAMVGEENIFVVSEAE
jgi:hypothetical protein